MLDAYTDKRNFARSPEPKPRRRNRAKGALSFVVQKHRARRLHYDFRLEVDGVLKSWAVPKGPSVDPADKRLAVMVEDHPLDYGSFEDVIPAGEYGAGEVIVWDAGTYAPEEAGTLITDRKRAEAQMRAGLALGKLSFVLQGRKLRGSWTLVKTQRGENEWLLIKHEDAFAEPGRDILQENRSVTSGRTIEELLTTRPPKRRRRASAPPSPAVANLETVPGVRRAPLSAASLLPMLASLTDRPFSDPEWLFEPKLDGMRALAVIRNGTARLYSRRGQEATHLFPGLAAHLSQRVKGEMILDGEIVAPDAQGVPSFQRLQQRINITRPADIARADTAIPVFYYLFDVVHLNGYDLSGARLDWRKSLLERTVSPSGPVRLVAHFEQDGELAYQAALRHGFEGVVAKRKDSPYEQRRSRRWLKITASQSDDFVIGGYTEGTGHRLSSFGALLLGQYDTDGKLHFAGHVGTGFDDTLLSDLLARLRSLTSERCPFAERPTLNAPTTWVRPELVAEVKFMQRTADGRLRAPVFVRLREDKPAQDATPARVVTPPAKQEPERTAVQVEVVLAQLGQNRDRLTLAFDGFEVPVTNLDKPLWPAHDGRRALTKRDLLIYLTRCSAYLLPHLEDRPITLTRYPNGIQGGHFYQRHVELSIPSFVETVTVYSEHNRGDREFLLCNNLATLVWLGQLANIELHTWFSRVNPRPDGEHLSLQFAGSQANVDQSLLNYPDFLVFDLDPYLYSGREAKGAEPELNQAAFQKTCEVARRLKGMLESLGLTPFVKTSGKTGLHVYVPILRQYPFEVIRAACKTIGRYLMKAYPADVTMEWATARRTGKVFFDHNMNARSKTIASVYSPRAVPHAGVSIPLRWEELGHVYPGVLTLETASARLEEYGDLWAGILQAKHDLKTLIETMQAHPVPQ